jgi:hypothetical protein
MKLYKRILWLVPAIALCACTVQHLRPSRPLPKSAQWVVLPVVNLSATPLAGEKVEALLDNALRLHGLENLYRQRPGSAGGGDLLLNDNRRYELALDAARKGPANFGVTGEVEEWRYKSGLDGNPAVGLTLRVIALPSGRVVWTASGAKTGWGYANVSGTAQQLIDDLLKGLILK